jgi:hypothetical protein
LLFVCFLDCLFACCLLKCLLPFRRGAAVHGAGRGAGGSHQERGGVGVGPDGAPQP